MSDQKILYFDKFHQEAACKKELTSHVQEEASCRHMKKRYSLSKVGHVCTSAECICLRCGRQKRISVDEKDLDSIENPEFRGDALIEWTARMYGWILLSGVAVNGKPHPYFLCPKCIEADIENFLRFQRAFQQD